MNRIKLWFASICLCFLFSCSNENIIYTEAPNTNVSSVRSLEEVLAIAEKSLGILEEGTTRADNPACRKIDMQNIKVVGKNGTRSLSQGSESSPLLYIVNFADSMGYSIVSANRNTEGLIAVTEKGSCDPDDIENPGLQYYMDCAKRYVAESRSLDPILPTSDTVITVTARIPMLDTKWKQTGTWGAYCPNGICGCSPLALLEVMGHYKYPENVDLSFLGESSYSLNLDWDDMLLHKKDKQTSRYFPCCNASTSSHNALGLLVREIGHRANAHYNQDNTSVYVDSLPIVAWEMGFRVRAFSHSRECAITPLDKSHIIIIRGETRINTPGQEPKYMGHSWIIDGYRKEVWRITDYDLAEVNNSNAPVRIETYMYNHMNWGWGGVDNGFFAAGVFQPTEYHTLDPGSSYGSTTDDYCHYVTYYEIYPSDN